jgi:hypothetical protein
MFIIVSLALTLLAGLEFVQAFGSGAEKELINGIVKAINTAFIALATFELGVGIDKEYSVPENGDRIYPAVRRMVARFVSVTCVALVLEALILVIKYSQLEMAGNLPYPVAVMAGASLLLIGLGVFMHFTRPDAAALAASEVVPAGAAARADPLADDVPPAHAEVILKKP